ncbi:MAG: alanine racemase, partial [Acidobacteriota bacterium]
MFHTSHIELNETALRHNIRYLKKVISPNAKFSSVIKGNAYGHGIRHFVPLAERCGVRHFSVFSASEALETLESLTRASDIMIMGAIENDELEWAIVNQISFFVFELDRLECALKMAERLGIRTRIHVEVETGLNRTGLQGDQIDQAVDMILKSADHVVVEGVCTHYAGAESIQNYYRIQNQIKAFHELSARVERAGVDVRMKHTACSAAALVYPETIMDMVRFGIAHYGFWPSKETQMHYFLNRDPENGRNMDPLKRVISWKSRVMSVKDVRPGEFVGYGTSYQTTRARKIASVPVGYFNGFARNLSNLGHVLIRGRRAPVVG